MGIIKLPDQELKICAVSLRSLFKEFAHKKYYFRINFQAGIGGFGILGNLISIYIFSNKVEKLAPRHHLVK
jgi:hypothetical protein